MKDTGNMPASGKGFPSPSDIGQIARWMEGAGLDDFELTGPDGNRLRLSLAVSGTANQQLCSAVHPAPSEPEMLTVKAPYFGVLAPPPDRDQKAFPPVPKPIQAGEIVAQLEIGCLILPIMAPREGVIMEYLKNIGNIIGYGTPVCIIAPS